MTLSRIDPPTLQVREVDLDDPLVSVAELQRVLRELRAVRPGGSTRPRTVRTQAHRLEPEKRVGAAALAGKPDRLPADLAQEWVAVLAAHAGAGASTVALAVSDAAASTDRPAHLIETADPAHSGLLAASSAELGTDPSGRWRRGMRDHLTIDRRAEDTPPAGWPTDEDAAIPKLTVVDVGLPTSSDFARLTANMTPTIVVCRATVPGVRLTEKALARLLGSPVVVAVVGRRAWRGEVTSSAGPRLRQLRDAGGVVTVPFNRRLGVTGATQSPLPKPILAAGRSLLTRIEATRGGGEPVPAKTRPRPKGSTR